jgi:hypothetical protein
MSYLSQQNLSLDNDFGARSRAAITGQGTVFKDDDRGDIAALATSLLTAAHPQELSTFLNMLAAAPGFAVKVDQGDGTVNSSLVSDEEILSAVQAEWPTVAALFYGPDGGPPL